ncbi:hypothetical protein K440DRAFT_661303 [Wilcoxina mikolae CBS 423.85]|nr:hypothetical protein K440DRAFT_661303 [Wilcoxina mikolae CBS 423.85]
MKAYFRKIFPSCFKKPHDYEGEPEAFLARGRIPCLHCNDPAHTSGQHFTLVEVEQASERYSHASEATTYLHQRTSRLPAGVRSHVQQPSGYHLPAALRQTQQQLRPVSNPAVVRHEESCYVVDYTRTLTTPQQVNREPPTRDRVSGPVHAPGSRTPTAEKPKQLIPLKQDDSRRQRRFDDVPGCLPYPETDLMLAVNPGHATNKQWHETYDNQDELINIPNTSPVTPPLPQSSRSRVSVGEFRTTSRPPPIMDKRVPPRCQNASSERMSESRGLPIGPHNQSSEPVVSDNEIPYHRPTSECRRNTPPWQPQTPAECVRPHQSYIHDHGASRGVGRGALSTAGLTTALPHQPDANPHQLQPFTRVPELPPTSPVSPEGFLVEDYDHELTFLGLARGGWP